ncbi:GntR family transcriptional regulator [Flexivirga meconopsidis]|uniref:GntR family transcriptional regulator n=1 Tax=Flexivirga meconopsidis TaxID=2977121 RepID=UPI00223F6841|nr:winged helix-turn-helix domain-containing protein [Flexivirga meconopsidis]
MPYDDRDHPAPYQQIATDIRAKIDAGTYPSGSKLPSGNELSAQYGVARMTVLQAIRLLREDGYVLSRAGSGVYVRKPATAVTSLASSVQAAFSHRNVRIAFFGSGGRHLVEGARQAVDRVVPGNRPREVDIRWLTPALAPSEHRRYGGLMDDLLTSAEADGLLRNVKFETRQIDLPPFLDLALLNHRTAVVRLRFPKGADASSDLFAEPGDTKSLSSQKESDPTYRQWSKWFDRFWKQAATDPTRSSLKGTRDD